MIEIELTKGFVAVVDDEDADLDLYKWRANISKKGKTHYAIRSVKQDKQATYVRMHRVVLSRVLNRVLLPDEYVDHIDQNGLNNLRGNLRLATRSQNCANVSRSAGNKFGLKGVFRQPDSRWFSAIRVNGRYIHLGRFDTKEAAHQAYCEAALKYFGEFATFAD